MDIAAIQAVGVAPATLVRPEATATVSAPKSNFVDWLDEQVRTVGNEIHSADREVQKLALGETENLHQVMLSLERARMSMDLLVQVRNRLLDAYQDVLRMQV